MKKYSLSYLLTCLCFIAFFLVSFQNCTQIYDFEITGTNNSSNNSASSNQLGNGEGYSGKPDIYEFKDPANPCADIGANQQPLPNAQIFYYPVSDDAQLVRRDCTDITPQNLTSAQFSVLPMGAGVVYNSQNFTPANIGDFDILAAACTPGRTMLANPVRSNMLSAGLDLTNSVWYGYPGVSATYSGVMASYPAFNITRNDANYLEAWRHPSQTPVFTAGEDYVFSFYVKQNAAEEAYFIAYFPSTVDLEFTFNLMTGAVTNTVNLGGVSNVSTSARIFNGGVYISVYFRPNVSGQINVGVGSNSPVLGSQITATAYQLENASNFCAP